MYIDKPLATVPVGDWAAAYGEKKDAIERTAWCGRLSDERIQRMRAGYYGSITHIDYQLGFLIESLKSMKLWENTLLIFVSDHGDMLGDHNLLRKCFAYEGSSRIPFVVKYPAGTDCRSGVYDDVVGLQDVTPTMLDVAGIDIPEWITGKSVLDVTRDSASGSSVRDFFHGEHSPCYDTSLGMHYLTDGCMKYVWYPYNNVEQLFDLSADPTECRNLIGNADYADAHTMWRGRLIETLHRRGDPLSDGKALLPTNEWYAPDVPSKVTVEYKESYV